MKKNQPGRYAQLKRLPWRQVPAGARQHDRGHGRDEHRTLKAVTAAGTRMVSFGHARRRRQNGIFCQLFCRMRSSNYQDL